MIADIRGDCAEEVKDALMRRLIDNRNYSVLTRDNLDQIIGEKKAEWSGDFNTETATKLGRLMGASLWIVGRVAYCGQSYETAAGDTKSPLFSILAGLQIIDLETGKVLVSSSSQGTYHPQQVVPFFFTKAAASEQFLTGSASQTAGSSTPPSIIRGLGGVSAFEGSRQPPFPAMSSSAGSGGPVEFAALRAADDLADEFANRFFGRPSWENVELWSNQRWRYDAVVRLIKLGHCHEAVQYMQEVASRDLQRLDEVDTAEYLHNFGVALLCANDLEAATGKLQAAYRIENNPYTLNMLNLVGKLSEWSLRVANEKEPEVAQLISAWRR